MLKLDAILNRVIPREELKQSVARLRIKSNKIVFTNGCFDLLHMGHVDYLSKAADCGTKLIVGVNSDASVRRLKKGPSRPIQNETSRALIIAALHFVDIVTVFDEDTPYELIKLIQPDVLVKGADYKIEEIAGHDIVLAKGGEVKLIELVKGYSTSAIEKKIKEIN
ncbi:MAG: D-glycero-beta-D-manno-heptose 1-phosphate adenylyltransferase [Bacteroidia bacterium]|nr:D-glycero-beta-D-manno-heptose 1-phosphate adenylyltransferase [Bacteroidia bacterium]